MKERLTLIFGGALFDTGLAIGAHILVGGAAATFSAAVVLLLAIGLRFVAAALALALGARAVLERRMAIRLRRRIAICV